MPVPTFEFTDRAVPVVQMGRFPRGYRGKSRWGRDTWNGGKWGRNPFTVYDPIWSEVTCDVYEVTTDTGRGSASDRFRPGTAQIIASNLTGWGDGEVPVTWPDFVDDFEREGPELDSSWARWVEMETLRPAMDQLVIEAGAAVVQKHVDTTPAPTVLDLVLRGTYQGQGDSVSMTIGPFPDGEVDDVVWLSLAQQAGAPLTPPVIPGWTRIESPTFIYGYPDSWYWSVYRHRLTGEEVATGDPWTVSMPSSWNWTAWCVGGVGDPSEIFAYDNLAGAFGVASGSFHIEVGPSGGSAIPMPVDGCFVIRIGMSIPPIGVNAAAVASVTGLAETSSGNGAGTWDFRQYLFIDGGTTTPHAYAGATTAPTTNIPWAAPPSPPWTLQSREISIILIPGEPPPPESPPYQGSSGNKWMLPYTGDHYLQAVVSGLAAPEPVWPDAGFLVELAVHLGAADLSCQVAGFEWVPDWDDPDHTGTLTWWLRRRNAAGAWTGPALATGTIDMGADGFPELAVLRVEADGPPLGETTPGVLRIFFQGTLLATVTDPTPPTGEYIAIYSDYHAGSLSYGRTIQPGPTRFEEIAAGTHGPTPIYLEPGVLIRVGVWHRRFDYRWMFRGYVDAITPVYDPVRDDSVRIECIDALGEVGRLRVPDYQTSNDFEATDRVRHILDEAEWPRALRSLDDDATIMAATYGGGRVVDLLTQTAESCGGAVYGGQNTGDLVFRRRDWQGYDPDKEPVDGYITDFDVDFAGVVVCPSGWERSWDRHDMSTRVIYTNQDGDEFSYRNGDAERRWGVEEYRRDLVTVYGHDIKVLAKRQLRVRGPDKFPRVEAVFLDAATGDDALDLMATATFTRPHHYQCQLRRPDGFVFNHRMLVTGLRHVFSPHRWTLRLALDLARPFISQGGRWGDDAHPTDRTGRWGVDTWGHAR